MDIGYVMKSDNYTVTFGVNLNTESNPMSYGTIAPHLAVVKTPDNTDEKDDLDSSWTSMSF